MPTLECDFYCMVWLMYLVPTLLWWTCLKIKGKKKTTLNSDIALMPFALLFFLCTATGQIKPDYITD